MLSRLWLLLVSAVLAGWVRRLSLSSCFVVFDILAFAQVRALEFGQYIFCIIIIRNAGFF
jgi:hypothetical protein